MDSQRSPALETVVNEGGGAQQPAALDVLPNSPDPSITIENTVTTIAITNQEQQRTGKRALGNAEDGADRPLKRRPGATDSNPPAHPQRAGMLNVLEDEAAVISPLG